MVQDRRRWLLLAAAVFCCTGAASAAAPQRVIARIDLSKPFRLAPGASFTAIQGPEVEDPAYGEGTVPGRIRLCVRTRPSAPCSPDLSDSLNFGGAADEWSEIHYLRTAEIVRPRGSSAAPLLHLQVGSFEGINGDERRAALLVAYRPVARRFDVIFREQFGLNNNQEARYLASGPLQGAMLTVHPTGGAPFGYWVAVHRLTPDYRYRQVLRYRSATRYNDGNPLAVIDSEMPNILQRLGLWRPGQPLPLPKVPCPRPRLVKGALWCS